MEHELHDLFSQLCWSICNQLLWGWISSGDHYIWIEAKHCSTAIEFKKNFLNKGKIKRPITEIRIGNLNSQTLPHKNKKSRRKCILCLKPWNESSSEHMNWIPQWRIEKERRIVLLTREYTWYCFLRNTAAMVGSGKK